MCQLLLHLLQIYLQIGHPLIAAHVSKFSAFTVPKTTLNSTGTDGHPYHTPAVFRNKSTTLPCNNNCTGCFIAQRSDDLNQPAVDVVF